MKLVWVIATLLFDLSRSSISGQTDMSRLWSSKKSSDWSIQEPFEKNQLAPPLDPGDSEMGVELSPFSEEEFANFYNRFVLEYADMLYAAGMFEDKLKASVAGKMEMASLFPEGRASRGHHLFNIERNREVVGCLWYAEEKSLIKSENTAWLCDIYVKPAYRNMGYAKASIRKMEAHLKSLGVTRVGMNVFSSNPHAKRLYEGLGYRVVDTIFTEDQKEVIRYELSKRL